MLTRNQAITAMVLAETVADGLGEHTDKRWLFIEGWADELAMTGADAVGKISSHGTGPEAGEWTRRTGTVALRAVPVACPIGQSCGVSNGQSRTAV